MILIWAGGIREQITLGYPRHPPSLPAGSLWRSRLQTEAAKTMLSVRGARPGYGPSLMSSPEMGEALGRRMEQYNYVLLSAPCSPLTTAHTHTPRNLPLRPCHPHLSGTLGGGHPRTRDPKSTGAWKVPFTRKGLLLRLHQTSPPLSLRFGLSNKDLRPVP